MSQATILVVDDERVIRSLICDVLRDAGYRTIAADNGATATEVTDSEHPDLIVLDLQMPVMDGWTFCRQFRTNGHATPVVIVSAHGATRAQRELQAAGAVEKPFDPDHLLKVVHSLVPAR